MSAESLATFHAYLAEQERKRQRPSCLLRARRRVSAALRNPAGVPTCGEAAASGRKRSLARRSVVVVGAVTLGAGIGTGTAVAYWAAGGTGSGTVSTATTAAITVTPGTVSGTLLYPGLAANGTSSGGDLVVEVTNPNPFRVSVVLSPGGSAVASGCTTSDVSFAGGTITIEANTTSPVTRTVRQSVAMGTGTSSDCQGKTLSVPVQATATSPSS